MEIIPVIDLLDGQVVHARHGERQHYQPIQSALCSGSKPLAIVQALLELYPFDQLYIADLDAIQQRGHHRQSISDIRAYYPKIQIWLDAGISCVDNLSVWQGLDLNWVIGSESLRSLDNYLGLKQHCGKNHILSLDFNAQDSITQIYSGPAELLQDSVHWPDRVIVMTLAQVGSNLGPDCPLLTKILSLKTQQEIYAAGGVRDMADIQDLGKMGVDGVLIASALHNRQITGAEIHGYMS